MSQPVPTPAYDALDLAHQRFVDRVMAGDTLTDAYAAAYPEANRESARSAGPRLFATVRIAEAVGERKAQLAARVNVTPQRIVEEYAAMAFANMKTFMTWGPEGVTLMGDETLSEVDARCVAEVSQTRTKDGGSLRLKLHDKKAALDRLAELFEITPEKIRALYPNVADAEIIDGVVSIFKKARELRDAKKAAGGVK